MLTKNILIGLGSLLLGSLNFWWTFKHPVRKENDWNNSNFSGYIASIGFIVLGYLTLIGYFEW